MAKEPNYDMVDEMAEPAAKDASEGELPASLMMLADKLGFDETKAKALKDFIHECQSTSYDEAEPEGDTETEV